MKRSLKYIIVLFCLGLYQSGKAQAVQGTINLTFLNRHVDYVNKVWTFDVYAAAAADYVTPYADWAGMSIRCDVAMAAGVSIITASSFNTPNTIYADAGNGFTTTFAGAAPTGSIKFGLAIARNNKPDLGVTPVLITSVTVYFTGGNLTGNELITPRTGLASSGSFWANTDGVGRPFNAPVNFTLPIKLESFTAAKAGTTVNLNWLVTSETNAKGYDVERSSGNGAAFTLIGNVAANNSGKYSSTDASPLSGVNYYRLKMIDIDGKFKYSDVRTVLFDGTAVLFDIYPNPVVSNKLNLHLQQNTYVGKGQAILTDIAGRSIQSININIVKGNNQLPITVKNLNSGTYFITVYDAQGNVITDAKKLVKQ